MEKKTDINTVIQGAAGQGPGTQGMWTRVLLGAGSCSQSTLGQDGG